MNEWTALGSASALNVFGIILGRTQGYRNHTYIPLILPKRNLASMYYQNFLSIKPTPRGGLWFPELLCQR